MSLSDRELKAFLDEKADLYERPEFIKEDPIQIPHSFSKKEDIEIIGLLTATIAWGQRPTIIKNAFRMAEMMDQSPHDFILNFERSDLDRTEGFVHRTFNSTDLQFFMYSLQDIYHKGGLEKVFTAAFKKHQHSAEAIAAFRQEFLSIPHEKRSEKHISDPLKGSSAKRLNMFLRWMVRSNERGVDFGHWKDIDPAWLSVPLDVHTGNMARKLGLLQRKQNDQKAVMELDARLRSFDPKDPVKYDMALFGLGIYEGF